MNLLIGKGVSYSEQAMRTGYSNAAKEAGHTVTVKDLSKAPIFDLFDIFKPNAIMLGSNEISQAVVKCFNEFKIPMYLWLNKTVDITEEQMVLLLNLDPTNCHNLICGSEYNNDSDLHPEDKDKVKFILPAFDSIKFPKGEYKEELACEMSYIGFYDKWVKSEIQSYTRGTYNYNIKVFGYGKWDIPEYIGVIKTPKVFSDVVVSSKLNLNFDSISERLFKIIGCGGVSHFRCREYKTEIEKWYCTYKDSVVTCNDYDAFINNHTYKQRLKELGL